MPGEKKCDAMASLKGPSLIFMKQRKDEEREYEYERRTGGIDVKELGADAFVEKPRNESAAQESASSVQQCQ